MNTQLQIYEHDPALAEWIGTIGFDLHQAFSVDLEELFIKEKVNLMPEKVKKKSVILLVQTTALKHHYLHIEEKRNIFHLLLPTFGFYFGLIEINTPIFHH